VINRIKKNDLVAVISGKDRGKQGQVLSIDKEKGRVIVKGVSIVTRHVKARRQGEKSGIVKDEGYMSLSNVMPVCPSCKKPCRVRVTLINEGKRVRTCHRCAEAF